MNTPKILKRTIMIDESPSRVWAALTDPKKTRLYMFNCEVVTDWIVGNSIRWRGNYMGYESRERGIVLKCDKDKVLKYTSFDPGYGLADRNENYLRIGYMLLPKGTKTELTTTIENLNNDPTRLNHIAKGWDSVVIPNLKKIFERLPAG